MEKIIDDRGECRSEENEECDVCDDEQNIDQGEIPTDHRKIQAACRNGDRADDRGGSSAGEVVAESECGRLDGGDGEIVSCAAHLILNHEHIGAKRHGHAGHRKQ